METGKALSDVIGDLLERGYSLDFQALEQYKQGLGGEPMQALPAGGFVIDEVYVCEDGTSGFIYVFAVSSVRYGMKGILINAMSTENTLTIGEILGKIKSAFIHLFKNAS